MPDLEETLAGRFREAISKAFGLEADPLVRPTQDPAFGDYQANAAMGLAAQLSASPRRVAERIVEHLEVADLAQPPEVAGPGFINLRLLPDYLGRLGAELAADERMGLEANAVPETIVVEYSSPNAVKEMHVGHLRSTVIGDALARVLEVVGQRVIRQNHIGDWGTQFGMLVEYLVELGSAEQVHFDDVTQLYQEAQARFQADPDFAERARKRVVALQGGDEVTLDIWRRLVAESQRHFEEIYRRLGVTLDDYRGESFYNAMLPEVVAELERKGLTQVSDGAVCVFPEGFARPDGTPLPFMVQKSDGGYLYATTDLAALRYRIFDLEAERIVYVVDARQSQHFAMLFATARMAGWLGEDVRVEHCAFGSVLGEDGRPFRTRAGETVRLTHLLDEAEQRAAAVVAEKNPELGADDRKRVAQAVGIGALKYADLSSHRLKDYVFSWDRMLAMDGNTAPYLQYAYARIRSIFRRGSVDTETLRSGGPLRIEHPAERALLIQVGRLPGTVRAVAETLEPHRLCTHLYDLATAFSGFYESCPVLQAGDPQQRRSRLTLCDLTARGLKLGLGMLGIDVLDRM
jgi:arginyl-tRNA synthetase